MADLPDFHDEFHYNDDVRSALCAYNELFKGTPLKKVEGVPEVINIVSNPRRSSRNFTEIAMMQLREKAFGGFKRGEMVIYAGSPSQQMKSDFARSIMGHSTEGFRYLPTDSYAYFDYQPRKDFDIFPLSIKEPSVSEICRKNWVSVMLQKERQ